MNPRVIGAVGWLVIAHGLSHGVLPLRGISTSAALIGDWTPVLLYTVSMVGFAGAGLGLLGVRPLDRAISPLLVLAAGLSLVAIVHLGHGDLWIGAGLDIVLLFVGLWRASTGWPAGPQPGRYLRALGQGCAAMVLAYLATTAVMWPSIDAPTDPRVPVWRAAVDFATVLPRFFMQGQ